jgi:L-ascorbate metabolism protein UlaG (beta-lactamase superfamily)
MTDTSEGLYSIHMLPEETAQAAMDVGARMLLPAHGGKFALARHPWQEPYQRLLQASQGKGYKLLTPEIGEAAYLDGEQPRPFDDWRERMR